MLKRQHLLLVLLCRRIPHNFVCCFDEADKLVVLILKRVLMSTRLEQSLPPTLIMTFENDFKTYTEISSHMSCIVAPPRAQFNFLFQASGVYSLNDGVTNKKGSFLMS